MVRPCTQSPQTTRKDYSVESTAGSPLSLLSMSSHYLHSNSHFSGTSFPATDNSNSHLQVSSQVPQRCREESRRSCGLFHPVKLCKELTLRDILEIPDDVYGFTDTLNAPEDVYGFTDTLQVERCPYSSSFAAACSLVSCSSLDESSTNTRTSSACSRLSRHIVPETSPICPIRQDPTENISALVRTLSSSSLDRLVSGVMTPTPMVTTYKNLVTDDSGSRKRLFDEGDGLHDFEDECDPIAEKYASSNVDGPAVREGADCEMQNGRSEKTRGQLYRAYQEYQWTKKFSEMCEYQRRFGHCIVPYSYTENPTLVRWVKRQRYQYKLHTEGRKNSTMTLERIAALENIGFVWDSQGASWMERLQELKAFKAAFGHCNVPTNYHKNKCLATWIKGQSMFIVLQSCDQL
jgi:Helicase associated domain